MRFPFLCFLSGFFACGGFVFASDFCTMDYAPVCGEAKDFSGDLHTFGNGCLLEQKSETYRYLHDGECVVLEMPSQPLGYFSDVNFDHVHHSAIEWAHSEGIVQGYDDGTFRSEKLVNRAEFVKILLEARFTSDVYEGEGCFPDVASGEWFTGYVCFARNSGILDGYSDGYFRPGDFVNFAEASKIIVNTLVGPTTPYERGNWYDAFVVKLEEREAIPKSLLYDEAGRMGTSERYDFGRNITRGEMVEMVWRIAGR